MEKTAYPQNVTLVEVGPRDGFQNEEKFIPTVLKVQMIQRLMAAGLRQIQIASFVHPEKMPQMADAEEVCRRLAFPEGVEFSGLALNERGVLRAALAGVQVVDVSISTSDTHSRENAGMSLAEARKRLKKMIRQGKSEGLEVRAGFSNIWGCNYEGIVPVKRIQDMLKEAVDHGADKIALADSTGLATPRSISTMLEQVRTHLPSVPLILHLHDSRGLALVNIYEALNYGVSWFDTSMGGMGGCPFIPGAAGNVATEDVANLMVGLGIQTGIDILSVAQCTLHMERHQGKKYPGRLHRLMERKTTA